MATVVHKRHLVLYGWIVAAALVLLVGCVWQTLSYLSFIHRDQEQAQAEVASTTEERKVPILQRLFSSATVQGTQVPFQFEIADTQAEQEQGLGGRADIPSGYGMLFVFPKDDTYGFWMKDMEAPIDMLWLSDSGQVVYALTNVATSTYPSVFYPTEPARYVLETRAGESLRMGWTVGKSVPLPLPYGR